MQRQTIYLKSSWLAKKVRFSDRYPLGTEKNHILNKSRGGIEFKEGYLPTGGLDFGSFALKVDEKNVKLNIWDTVY